MIYPNYAFINPQEGDKKTVVKDKGIFEETITKIKKNHLDNTWDIEKEDTEITDYSNISEKTKQDLINLLKAKMQIITKLEGEARRNELIEICDLESILFKLK